VVGKEVAMNYIFPLYSEPAYGLVMVPIALAALVAVIVGAAIRVRYLKRHGRWGKEER
jgi:hypothetical protein